MIMRIRIIRLGPGSSISKGPRIQREQKMFPVLTNLWDAAGIAYAPSPAPSDKRYNKPRTLELQRFRDPGLWGLGLLHEFCNPEP